MKKLLLFTLLLFSFSCSNDDDKQEDITILGKWYYDYYTLDGERFGYDYINDGCDSDFEKGYVEYFDTGIYAVSAFQDCEWIHYSDYFYTLSGTELKIKTTANGPESISKILLLKEKTLAIIRYSEFEEKEFIEYFKR